jgi:hypothetical protein
MPSFLYRLNENQNTVNSMTKDLAMASAPFDALIEKILDLCKRRFSRMLNKKTKACHAVNAK